TLAVATTKSGAATTCTSAEPFSRVHTLGATRDTLSAMPSVANSSSTRAAESRAIGKNTLPQVQLENRLLRVQPVCRLAPHRGAWPVEDRGADFLAAVRGQAMEHDRALRRPREQRVVHAEPGERAPARRGLRLLTHRCPHVGGHHIGAGRRLRRVADD